MGVVLFAGRSGRDAPGPQRLRPGPRLPGDVEQVAAVLRHRPGAPPGAGAEAAGDRLPVGPAPRAGPATWRARLKWQALLLSGRGNLSACTAVASPISLRHDLHRHGRLGDSVGVEVG